MGRVWVLNDLFVRDTARREGVARQLMTKAQEFCVDSSGPVARSCAVADT